jgi:hypothetical protein
VRERLAEAFGGSEREWNDFVGRHFGQRSELVHGLGKREVEEQEVESLRDLVQALLERDFGWSTPSGAIVSGARPGSALGHSGFAPSLWCSRRDRASA